MPFFKPIEKILQANRENPKFKLILGKYLKKSITCFKCGNVIHTHEEKETDVRIATQIVADAYQKNCDISIVVSADSDMIPAIELATELSNLQQKLVKRFLYISLLTSTPVILLLWVWVSLSI